jgi:hypothetical protein
LLIAFLVLVARYPPLRATPHGRVLPVTLLANGTALLLGEAHEFLVLPALFEQLTAFAIQVDRFNPCIRLAPLVPTIGTRFDQRKRLRQPERGQSMVAVVFDVVCVFRVK